MNEFKKDALESMGDLSTSIYKRYFFMFCGHLSMVMAVIGIILPVMPATPFVLLAAYCYARSSKKFYFYLLNNKYFGENVRHWEESRCIARRIKIMAFITLLLMFSITIFIVLDSFQMRVWTGAFAVIAIASLALVPSCEHKEQNKSNPSQG